ncbi:DUF2530 domain-containing protein [Rhodococcus sp. IEGM 1379]|uniref:DUF2530 domain-containing protein n=1 Tax=Rhodococcus sp. IEGM 1379 TaxID=3047086 RepID=UPI0024B71EF3|nr:DUF2530 domain-containing protein [Rhodococcus sp. IEGM 1379]MDI9914866.1 DUF2530 domain-containing protein [Rhodococcus sp. IEGM 1379]
MNETRNTTHLIERLSAPAPALVIGTAVWVVATVVVLLSGDRWSSALPVCYAGIGVGFIGYGLFWIQRRAALRGSKGAQQGAGLTD